MLNTQQMLAVKSRREKVIEMPELGGQLRCASLSAAGAARFRALLKRQEKGEDVDHELTRLVLLESCIDGDGKPLFNAESVDLFLANVDARLAARLVDEITPLLRGPEVPPGNSSGAQSAG